MYVKGVSEEELDRAEEELGWPLPTHLRLLYRFHNGQASGSTLLRETYRLGALHDSTLFVGQWSCRSVRCWRLFASLSGVLDQGRRIASFFFYPHPFPDVCKVQGFDEFCPRKSPKLRSCTPAVRVYVSWRWEERRGHAGGQDTCDKSGLASPRV